MWIAYVVGRFPSPSETFIAREAEALRARGAEVTIFPLWRDPAAGITPDGPFVHRCTRWPAFEDDPELRAFRWQCYFATNLLFRPGPAVRALWYMSMAVEMALRLKALDVERVHAHFANLPSTVGWVAASLAKVPFSFAVHARDIFVEHHFLRAKARAADHIIACNSAAASLAADLVKPTDRAKIELIPHGLPLEQFGFRREPASGEPLILGVGRLVEKKGFTDLITAMARLRERGVKATCWLLGDGPERETLSRGIAELGLEGSVVLKGWMRQDELMAAYERAALLVAPSVVAKDGDRDGLPNVVVEAAAKGLPIVATNVGGIGDLVRDGETGLVAREKDSENLAEKIAAVLDDTESAMARARRAREEVEARFDQEKCIRRLMEILGKP